MFGLISRPQKIEIINDKTLKRILIALNESTEWSQVHILDFLAENIPTSAKKAEM